MMKRVLLIGLIARAIVAAALGSLWLSSGSVTVSVIHTNDMHGYVEAETVKVGSQSFTMGGMANVVGNIDRWRAANPDHTLVLDAGDIWQGTFISSRSQGEIMIDAMNIAGYTAAVPGNHDFDFGQDVLKARVAQAHFPFLAANIIEEATGRTPPFLKPYLITKVGNIRVGIIGLGYPGTPFITKPSNVAGLQFLSGAEAVNHYLDGVRRQADIVIVLSHMGMDEDEKLASTVAGIDVIVGGHSHIVQTNAKQVGQTIIVQAGSNAQYIGKLDLVYDRLHHKVTSFTRANEVVPVVGTTVNAAVEQMVQKKAAEAAEILTKPIGETLVDLDNCYAGECPLGNLVADAMLAAGQADAHPADVAMHNNSGLRARLARGTITYGNLFQVLPFGNVMTALDLTGEQILAILEKTVSGRPGNLVVSGMTYSFDQTRPAGSRITRVTIRGKPLDRQAVYRVQTIDYLAAGGDGQETFKQGKNVVYGDPVVDVVAEYIRQHSPVQPRIEGRILPR